MVWVQNFAVFRQHIFAKFDILNGSLKFLQLRDFAFDGGDYRPHCWTRCRKRAFIALPFGKLICIKRESIWNLLTNDSLYFAIYITQWICWNKYSAVTFFAQKWTEIRAQFGWINAPFAFAAEKFAFPQMLLASMSASQNISVGQKQFLSSFQIHRCSQDHSGK